MRRRLALVMFLASLLVALAAGSSADAAFPGANGKIASDGIYTENPDGTGFALVPGLPSSVDDQPTSNWEPDWSPDGTKIAFSSICADEEICGSRSEIFVINADGSGLTRLTTGFASENTAPSWSPDGGKIVFQSSRGGLGESLWVMNSDGSDQHALNVPGVVPEWSPDGTKIAFLSQGFPHIYTVNPDGSGQAQLTSGSDAEGVLDWSPDARKIVFVRTRSCCREDVFIMNADGTGQLNLTNDIGNSDRDPAWSPDGRKIAWNRSFTDSSGTYHSSQLFVMNADGSNPTGTGHFVNPNEDWQALPVATYEHPQSATQLNVSLVPAFKPCGTGGNPSNAKHAPPLATNSCSPPKPSVLAAVGVRSLSSAQMSVTPGDTDPTNGNQANVTLSASLTDIQSTAGGDYNPNPSGADLTAVTRLRFTDKSNGYGGLPATATEYDFKVPIDCSSTANPTVGSTCAANTTANALVPGLIQEQRQTVVQTFRVRVDDSGANGIRGDSDDRIFMTQGVFIP